MARSPSTDAAPAGISEGNLLVVLCFVLLLGPVRNCTLIETSLRDSTSGVSWVPAPITGQEKTFGRGTAVKLSRAFLVVSFLLTSIAEGSAAYAQKRGPAQKSKPEQSSSAEAAKPAGAAKSAEDKADAKFSGLELRSIGPALVSGRIVSIAVDPANRAPYYVGAASGGVWKPVNDGATWTPVFEREGSYSIGTVDLDPRNPSVVWVGTGENNSQRSVGYGDGVYRSDDPGKSWKTLGLKNSAHIARILLYPRDSR